MFKLNPAPEFLADALLSEYGQTERVAVPVLWRHKSLSGLKAWLEGSRSRAPDEFLAEIIADMPALCDADGQPRPYSQAALAELLDNYHAAGKELIEAYIQALQESRRKN